jgi:hypothetical protein
MINKEKWSSLQADFSGVKQGFQDNPRWKRTRDELKKINNVST